MHSNWWADYLSYIELVALLAALGTILYRKLAAKWPSLVTGLAVELVTNLILIYYIKLHFPYTLFFYLYWGSQAIQFICRLWMIADIMRSFPGLDFLPSQLYLFVGTIGVTVGLAAAFYSWNHHGQIPTMHRSPATAFRDTVLVANNAAAIGFAAFSVVFLSTAKALNFGWSQIGAGIATWGFLRAVGKLVVAEMLQSHDPVIRVRGNALDSIVLIAVCFSWAFLVATYPQRGIGEYLSPISKERLSKLLT